MANPETADKVGYLFGFPIAHSMSPFVHNASFKKLGLNWSYTLLESKDTENFLRLLKDSKCYGMHTPNYSPHRPHNPDNSSHHQKGTTR